VACERARGGLDAPVALVLSGGGAKGAWEAGVAIAFVEHGIPVRVVAGSSAGALNAAMLADGRLDRLESLWQTITREQVYALRSSVVASALLPGFLSLFAVDRAGSLFDPAPLRALVTETLDLDRVRRSSVRLLVVTADLARRAPRVFDNATVSVDALMAAAAVPGAFPPVDVNGERLVDGGLVGRAPILDALAADVPVARAIVVMSYAPGEGGQAPTTLRRTLEEALEMAMIHQIRRDTELARLKYPAVDVQLLTPSEPLSLRPLDFEPAAMARALARGRADAAACLERWGER
jgi:NTE family protein